MSVAKCRGFLCIYLTSFTFNQLFKLSFRSETSPNLAVFWGIDSGELDYEFCESINVLCLIPNPNSGIELRKLLSSSLEAVLSIGSPPISLLLSRGEKNTYHHRYLRLLIKILMRSDSQLLYIYHCNFQWYNRKFVTCIVHGEILNIKLGRPLIQIRIRNWVSYKIIRAIGYTI